MERLAAEIDPPGVSFIAKAEDLYAPITIQEVNPKSRTRWVQNLSEFFYHPGKSRTEEWLFTEDILAAYIVLQRMNRDGDVNVQFRETPNVPTEPETEADTVY